jgi:hypothetical protein
MSKQSDLAAKIAQAKQRLPLPALMAQEGLAAHAQKTAHCPFHDDQHKSFSVFKGEDGFWHWKCFARCGEGDEIALVKKLKAVSLSEAMSLYLDMAGFPRSSPTLSREYPLDVCVSEFPCVSVSLVSEGQGTVENELLALAARNACRHAGDVAARRRFRLAWKVRGFELKLGRKLNTGELMQAFDEWYRRSQPFLSPEETRDDHWTAFLAELQKVRNPTSEDALEKALENVSKLSLEELPLIPNLPIAPENRRLVALHRELSRLNANGKYFLSYRDASRVSSGLTQQKAHTITFALETLGVIEIVSRGQAHPNGGKAAEFRYLLSEGEDRKSDEVQDGGFDL